MLRFPGVEVTAQIYESANSLVYRGCRQPDNEPIILKVLKENYPTPQELARYRTEYKITQSLNLAGCIKAYDLQPYQNTLVMFIEDFGGESLKIWMRQKKFTLAEFLQIAIATTESLGQIHTANIIHKDINPSNIVFNPKTGKLKIIDFGISTKFTRENPSLKNPNILEGTLAYMSPEQTGRMNRSLDYRTDFYSLGVTFYELLTGNLPFITTDALELVHCHIAKQPVPPHKLDSDIPKALSDIVMKLLTKTAEERYQSAWGVQADLASCLMQLETTGKIEEINAGKNDISERFQIPQKLYGREPEIESLLAAFERTSIQSELMLIAGYSGIGKTALVQELYKPLTQKRGYFIVGKFDQYQRNIPYSAIVNAFQELVKQLLAESETQLQNWREKIIEALGINGQVIVEVIPEIELIIGKQPPLPELGATESLNRFNLVFQSFIKVFTKPDHPLVIFLDDLQWADGASLKLMQLLMSNSSPGLFLIGAYRDNEVSSAHPLMLTLDEISKIGTIINRIFLWPLSLASVSELISETLDCAVEMAKPLAELLILKTQGNPFFLKEFLKSIYTEQYLYFDFTSLKWQWDLEQIQERGFTDNVVELMVSKIQILPENTQSILKIAACIGNQFDLKTLSLICEKHLQQMVNDLYAAVAENLVVLLGNMGDVELAVAGKLPDSQSIEYRFVHDRIQQAAYSLISEQDKPVVHRQIGKILLQSTPENQRDEKIFDIVNQLNFGFELISNQSERNELAELNLIAGKKAKGAAAYQSAFNYLQTGIKLLEEKDGKLRPNNLILELHQEATESAYLCGNFVQMEVLTNWVINHAKTVLDKVKVIEVNIWALIAQHKPLEALKIGGQFLQELGVKLPTNPNNLTILKELLGSKWVLAGKRIEDLADLPPMTDPYKLAALRLLLTLMGSASIGMPQLMPIIAYKQISLSVKYGNCAESIPAYGMYGSILCGFVGEIERGYQFGELALKLLEKSKNKQFKAKVIHPVHDFIKHWKVPVNHILPSFLEAYKSGLESGDLEFAGYAAQTYCGYLYLVGCDLPRIKREITTYRNEVVKLRQEQVAFQFKPFYQAVVNLLGESAQPCNLGEDDGDEQRIISLFIQAEDQLACWIFYFYKLILCYLFEAYTEAVDYAVKAKDYMEAGMGTLQYFYFHFFDSLIQLADYYNAPTKQQRQILRQTKINQKKIKKWAKHNPSIYLHKYTLVEAEISRIQGKDATASNHYDRAISLAKEHEYIQEAALGYELAAKFYLSRKKELTAKAYMQEARYYYQLWGAVAKVQDLEKKYPQLLDINQPKKQEISTTTSTTDSRSSFSLDIASIMKASEAISGEIVLDKLLSKLMKILIENVGAQKGYLILENQGKFLIEAECVVDTEETAILQATSVENSQKVCDSIVSYVARSQENVVLNNATTEGQFTNDPYIQTYQPKSILCAALMNQGQLAAIVYLENYLTANAFTPERLEILQLLSGQAAIAITNAKLYAEVKERENRLTQFMDAMPIGVTVHNTTGQITYANQTAHHLSEINITPEANTKKLAETYQLYLAGTNQLYPTNQMPIARSLAGETVKVDDMELHQTNKVLSLEVSSTPIVDETGKINYAVATFQDITERKQAENLLADYNRTLEQQVSDRTLELQQEIIERKRAEEAAQAANQAKSRFLANMSHELRTPLNTILGFSQLMKRYSNLFPEQQEHLGIITRSGEHLLNLINQVLDLSKIEAERATLNQTNFDLHHLLGDIEDMFQVQAESKGLQLLIERTPDVPQYMRTDEVKLRQVLINLLSNAIKFTSEGGISVKIKPEHSPNRIYFEIEDTGAGIADDELANLFEAFVQTQTGQNSQEGTGLGLTIARSFVRLMGGEMTVNSQLGRGTLFKFDIKVNAVEAAEHKHQNPTRQVVALEPNQPCYRILITDDRWDNRQLLIKLLSPFGFDLTEASNGMQAIEMWEQYSPHLIFMDMRMPMMDGYEATKRIKATIKGQATAIVAITASSFEEEKAVVLSAGCDDFIRKPFRERSIFDALQKHIGVRFVFAEVNAPPSFAETELNLLTKAALTELPSELVTHLQQAISNLDLELMQTVIEQIREINQALGSAIADCVKRFQYEQLLELISSLRKKI